MTMKRISRHKILLAGDSFAHCSQQVRKYFDLTSLVIYDCIEIRVEKSIPALDVDFINQLNQSQEKNREIAGRLIAEIVDSGITKTEDLIQIDQGYLSKTFHILSHFLDGFIGIDSHFYNLLDDSHWVPEHTLEAIKDNPERYWLLHLDGYTATPQKASLLHN